KTPYVHRRKKPSCLALLCHPLRPVCVTPAPRMSLSQSCSLVPLLKVVSHPQLQHFLGAEPWRAHTERRASCNKPFVNHAAFLRSVLPQDEAAGSTRCRCHALAVIGASQG